MDQLFSHFSQVQVKTPFTAAQTLTQPALVGGYSVELVRFFSLYSKTYVFFGFFSILS